MAKPAAIKYRAFISYSHADTSWAKWLHRGLEGFRIDKDLVGRETATGAIPKSLRPIFRDRDDFTAGHTLSEQTLAALDASHALIVICSPTSARSNYVNEEIRLFKSRHPDRPVVPLIVDGKPGDPQLECFPTSLKFKLDADGRITEESVELLAADARDEGDGKNLALAKVVAGLLDVSSDEVFRRAERARRRRLRLLGAGAAAVLGVVSLLGGWAEVQRERFANYLSLATNFQAFEVADETQGWEDPHKLAQDTLTAAQRIVSEIRGFKNVRILWFDDKPALSQEAKQKFREGMQGCLSKRSRILPLRKKPSSRTSMW
jgi:TIR domain